MIRPEGAASRKEPQGALGELEAAVVRCLREAKRHPVLLKNLQREVARSVESHRVGLVFSVLDRLASDGKVLSFGQGGDAEYYWTENIEKLKGRLCAIVGSHHKQFPYESGISAGDIRKRISETQTMNSRRNVDPRLFDLAMLECKKHGLVVEADRGVRLPDFIPLSSEDEVIRTLEAQILDFLGKKAHSRTSIDELSRQLGVEVRKLKVVVAGMLKTGRLVRIEDDRLLTLAVIEELKGVLTTEFKRKAQLRISDIKVLLGLSRSAAIPFMEYLDRTGFTRRNGDCRVLATAAKNQELKIPDREKTH